jgi:hypothetical protein
MLHITENVEIHAKKELREAPDAILQCVYGRKFIENATKRKPCNILEKMLHRSVDPERANAKAGGISPAKKRRGIWVV